MHMCSQKPETSQSISNYDNHAENGVPAQFTMKVYKLIATIFIRFHFKEKNST